EHCARPDAGGRTPSDYPLAGLDQAGVDRLVGDGRNVEDLLPLTPLQEGMLFHRLVGGADDVYVDQAALLLDGVADPHAFALAWQQVADATPTLRTSVVWEDVPAPLQVVHREARVPVTHVDWRDVAEDERAARFDRLRADDLARGIDLATPPLMRLTLVRLPDARLHLLWTSHHLILDGWSLAQVLTEVGERYAALTTGSTTPPPARRPFGDYVRWLAEQDGTAARAHWQQVLAGFATPTPLPVDRPLREAHQARSAGVHTTGLSDAASARLARTARAAGLTANTLVQGAWALLLGRQAGREEVVFGTTVSGRPPELPGADAMTGLFIATLPTRVRVPREGTLVDWLGALQYDQSEDRRFDHVPLTRMKALTELPERAALFDSIVVFENYPVDDDLAAAHGLRLSDLDGIETTNYPLSLVAYPGAELGLRLGYDPALFDAATVARMAEYLTVLFDGIAAGPERPPARLPLLTPARRRQVLDEWNDTAAPAPEATVADLWAAQVRRTPDAP
ncbi:condensation domain-containing protein, partial [Streptomyces spectabilis]|uniref:condensation domain-containing protein n=1 Tax=Streptomyces spectabilis TaxID=68270 RepID=UPI0033FB1E77